MTAKPLSIKPKAKLCEITEAKVVDDLTSYISTKENAKIPLEDLSFSVDSSNPSADQLHKFYQILGK